MPVSALAGWAELNLRTIIQQGGAHGSGSRRTVEYRNPKRIPNGGTFSMGFDDGVDHLSAWRDEVRSADGWFAITFEHERMGKPALWIEASDCADGDLRERVVLVQPYRKKFLGRITPTGSIVAAEPPA